MPSCEEVKEMISTVIPCELIEIEGDGHHFFARIVSEAFAGKSRLDRHRLIKDGLKKQISSNELHALSLNATLTPEEWRAKNKP